MAQQGQMTPEQVQELQEKIKNMSPEELKEFQKKQCIFCHIISGKVQSKKIYEDDKVIAILDINPANPGHVLIMPKEHYSILPQLSEEDISHTFNIAKTISNACLRALGVQGTNIIVQNGVAAGQKSQHFMVHVIPRKEGDGIQFEIPQKKMEDSQLEVVRAKLESHLGSPPKKAEPKPKQQIPFQEKKPEVEASFEEIAEEKKEEKEEKQQEVEEAKKEDKNKGQGKKAKGKNKPGKKEEISLDDIASLLGV